MSTDELRGRVMMSEYNKEELNMNLTIGKIKSTLRLLRALTEEGRNDGYIIRVDDCKLNIAKDSADAIEYLLKERENIQCVNTVNSTIEKAKNMVCELRGVQDRSDMARDAADTIESLLKELEVSTVPQAIDVLRKEFLKDQSEGSYYHTWVSNIACCIMNHQMENDHVKANNAARAFMRLLIGQGES
jgi:hypothetical protein